MSNDDWNKQAEAWAKQARAYCAKDVRMTRQMAKSISFAQRYGTKPQEELKAGDWVKVIGGPRRDLQGQTGRICQVEKETPYTETHKVLFYSSEDPSLVTTAWRFYSHELRKLHELELLAREAPDAS